MPLPKPKRKTKEARRKNVREVIRKLKKEKPRMPIRQRITIALAASGLNKRKKKRKKK